jgi:hypothetical protein
VTRTVVADMDEEGVLKVYLLHCYRNDGQKREKSRQIVQTGAKTVAKINVRMDRGFFEFLHCSIVT